MCGNLRPLAQPIYFCCYHFMHIQHRHQTHESRVAVLECHCDDEEFHPDVTPIILAAQRNDFTLVQVRVVYEVDLSLHTVVLFRSCSVAVFEWNCDDVECFINFYCNSCIQHKNAFTAYNWQKWKRVFLTCPCNKIYRDEAVGLKSCKYTLKIMIFVNMWNLGQFRENLIFCQLLLNWSSNLKILLHMCDTHNCDYLQHSTFRFNLIDFQINTYFPS